MKKKLAGLAVLALMLGGCAVSAKEEPAVYSGTVISSDDESTVIRIDSEICSEGDETASETDLHKGETVRLDGSENLLIFDGDRIMSAGELMDREKVVITFSENKTVMHTLDEAN